MAYNESNGKFTYPKTSEMIKVLQEHMELYGDTSVVFYFDGLRINKEVQMDFFKDAVVIEPIYEEDDE